MNAVSAGSGPRSFIPSARSFSTTGAIDAKPFAQVGLENTQHSFDAVGRQVVGYLAQRQVCARERNAQVAGDEQHDRQFGARAFREKLRVPGKRHATVGDNALCQGRRHHGAKIAVETAAQGDLETFEQGGGIRRVRSARRYGRRKRGIDDTQAIVELAVVADDNDIVDETTVCERVTEFRTDARRVAGRDDEWLRCRHA